MKCFLSITLIILWMFCMNACVKKAFVQTQTGNCAATPTGDTAIYLNNQTIALFAPCNKQVRSTLRNITDSRCPKNVNCIWAGTAKVLLRLDNTTDITLEINKQKDTAYHDRHYSFTLVDVVPYPGTSTDLQKAIIKVIEN